MMLIILKTNIKTQNYKAQKTCIKSFDVKLFEAKTKNNRQKVNATKTINTNKTFLTQLQHANNYSNFSLNAVAYYLAMPTS